jgi:quercetin dioxygenase-like cupin family protein
MKTRYPWGTMHWLANQELGNSTQVSVALMHLSAQQTSEEHQHPNCEEVITVTHGEVWCFESGNQHLLTFGKACVIPAGTFHYLHNQSDQPACLCLVYGSAERMYLPRTNT